MLVNVLIFLNVFTKYLSIAFTVQYIWTPFVITNFTTQKISIFARCRLNQIRSDQIPSLSIGLSSPI
ncbi:hypothetical protein L6452_33290 [Arctium lappa]|uniref:Uncharacterized protein n=1 Tax=Arctium lappa TaxID=4217 RepID=A0ACB8Z6X6_ARCLA|nr:hypothetical protein L6452_33290 [Arctium lappa]